MYWEVDKISGVDGSSILGVEIVSFTDLVGNIFVVVSAGSDGVVFDSSGIFNGILSTGDVVTGKLFGVEDKTDVVRSELGAEDVDFSCFEDSPRTVVDKMVVVMSELFTVGDTSSVTDFVVGSCVVVSEPLSLEVTSIAAVVDDVSCVEIVVFTSFETVVEDGGTLGVTFSSTVVFSTFKLVACVTACGVDDGFEVELLLVVDGDDVDDERLCSSVWDSGFGVEEYKVLATVEVRDEESTTGVVRLLVVVVVEDLCDEVEDVFCETVEEMAEPLVVWAVVSWVVDEETEEDTVVGSVVSSNDVSCGTVAEDTVVSAVVCFVDMGVESDETLLGVEAVISSPIISGVTILSIRLRELIDWVCMRLGSIKILSWLNPDLLRSSWIAFDAPVDWSWNISLMEIGVSLLSAVVSEVRVLVLSSTTASQCT